MPNNKDISVAEAESPFFDATAFANNAERAHVAFLKKLADMGVKREDLQNILETADKTLSAIKDLSAKYSRLAKKFGDKFKQEERTGLEAHIRKLGVKLDGSVRKKIEETAKEVLKNRTPATEQSTVEVLESSEIKKYIQHLEEKVAEMFRVLGIDPIKTLSPAEEHTKKPLEEIKRLYELYKTEPSSFIKADLDARIKKQGKALEEVIAKEIEKETGVTVQPGEDVVPEVIPAPVIGSPSMGKDDPRMKDQTWADVEINLAHVEAFSALPPRNKFQILRNTFNSADKFQRDRIRKLLDEVMKEDAISGGALKIGFDKWNEVQTNLDTAQIYFDNGDLENARRELGLVFNAGNDADGSQQSRARELRFNLATAYQKKGDVNVAREIFEEIVGGGDEKQKTDAETLLQNLAPMGKLANAAASDNSIASQEAGAVIEGDAVETALSRTNMAIEMGDIDGAFQILREIKGGNEAQKASVETLLDSPQMRRPALIYFINNLASKASARADDLFRTLGRGIEDYPGELAETREVLNGLINNGNPAQQAEAERLLKIMES